MDRMLMLACLAALLGACGSGETGSDGFCRSPVGGGAASTETTTDSGCVGCSVSDAPLAIDGSPGTHATMDFPAGAAGAQTLRGTAQPGVVFPEGSNAAVYMSFQDGHSGTVTVRTLLNGKVQGESTTTNGVSFVGNTSPTWFGAETPGPFDAMEVEVSDTQTGIVREMWILEICADH